jgi:hypothetical protein
MSFDHPEHKGIVIEQHAGDTWEVYNEMPTEDDPAPGGGQETMGEVIELIFGNV